MLRTTYYLLPTTYYLLPTTYYLLLATCYLLPPNCYITFMLHKSPDFILRSWGAQNLIIGQTLGLGNMWLSSCGIFAFGFFANINSAMCMCFSHCSAKLGLKCFGQLRNVFLQEILTQQFRKMIATCLSDPIFAQKSDSEVAITSQ